MKYMKNISKIALILMVAVSVACSAEPDRITGGANPEENPLPPDPSFSGNVTTQACITAVNAALAKAPCWKRGTPDSDNYSEVWFAPDSASSATGVLGFEGAGANDSEIEYEISNCDANEIRMQEANGIRVRVSGNEIDFEFDAWSQAYRYTATDDCRLSNQ